MALDDSSLGTYFHTGCSSDEWWSAQFDGKYTVSEVKIQNRPGTKTSDMERLAEA